MYLSSLFRILVAGLFLTCVSCGQDEAPKPSKQNEAKMDGQCKASDKECIKKAKEAKDAAQKLEDEKNACSIDGTKSWNGSQCVDNQAPEESDLDKRKAQCYSAGDKWENDQCLPQDSRKPTEAECTQLGNNWINYQCEDKDGNIVYVTPTPGTEAECKSRGMEWTNGRCQMPINSQNGGSFDAINVIATTLECVDLDSGTEVKLGENLKCFFKGLNK
jgi:hypothetical protein